MTKERYAVEIANYICDSNVERCEFDPSNCVGINIAICTQQLPLSSITNLIEEAKENSTTLIILSHTNSLERELYFEEVVKNHSSTSIDKKGYLILINGSLPSDTLFYKFMKKVYTKGRQKAKHH